jgi:hypothetical protein
MSVAVAISGQPLIDDNSQMRQLGRQLGDGRRHRGAAVDVEYSLAFNFEVWASCAKVADWSGRY